MATSRHQHGADAGYTSPAARAVWVLHSARPPSWSALIAAIVRSAPPKGRRRAPESRAPGMKGRKHRSERLHATVD
jgi:hypothetical protein